MDAKEKCKKLNLTQNVLKTRKNRIIVRNLPFSMDIEKLKTEAEKYGTVVDVNLPVKPDSTECRGFGFVQYQNEDDMKNAIKIFNGKKTFDRKLKCMISVSKNEHCIHKEIGKSETPKEKRKQIGENETIEKPPIKKVKQYDKADAVEGNTLFIRNLSYDTKKEELHSLFSSYGDINYVTLLKNDNGQCKGTAFIKYKRKSSVNDILDDFEKNPATFNLNYIQFDVKRALTKEKIESIGNLSKLKDASSRNLHLFREGAIRNADELQNMTKKDRVLRQKIEMNNRRKLKNPEIFVSQKRICIHNIPNSITEPILRTMILNCLNTFENIMLECRIIKEKLGYKNKKVCLGKSLGFAFVNFKNHQDALTILQHFNNRDIFDSEKKPVVEFSLENRRALITKENKIEKKKSTFIEKYIGKNKLKLNEKNRHRRIFSKKIGPKIRHKK